MKSRFRFYFLSAYCLAFLAPSAFAQRHEAPLPYVGQSGQLPFEVAVQFLKENLRGNEDGTFEYMGLSIMQKNEDGERSKRVKITIIQDGQLDDSVDGERWRMQLRLNSQQRWQIDTVKKDYMCGRMDSKKEWTEKLCP